VPGYKAAVLRAIECRPRLWLVAYCLLCWVPGWFAVPATDRDEARFAQATKQMTETGDVVTIMNGAVPRNRKPIGIYWLQLPGVLAAQAAGLAHENPIWPYRLPSLLGGLTAVLATHAIGRRLFSPRAALLGAAMLGGGLLLSAEVHIAKTDAALLGATTLAMAVLARAYVSRDMTFGAALLFWAALGVGVLLKGPITPMVAALAAIVLCVVERRARWLVALRPVPGIALLLVVVLPWFVAIGVATHGAFFQDAIGGDLAAKVAGGDDSHGAPFGTHLVLLLGTALAGGWAILCAAPSAWVSRREPATRFLLAWVVPAWLVFEAVPTKLPHYILPLLPPLCLLAARWAFEPARTPRWLAAVAIGASVLVALGLGGAAFALPFVVGGAWWLGVPGLLAGMLLAALLCVRGFTPPRRLCAGLLATPLLYAAILGFELPRLPALWLGPELAAAVAANGGAPGGMAVVGLQEPSLMFALGTGTQWLSGRDAAAFLAGRPGRMVAVEARHAAEFPRNHPLATVTGYNYSNGHRVSLALYGAHE